MHIILRSAHTVYLCVLCGSQNKQRLFPHTALTGWFLGAIAYSHGKCFLCCVYPSVCPSVRLHQLSSHDFREM
jgi:hypothetical protein